MTGIRQELRQLRLDRGLTQREVGRRMGISHVSVNRIEMKERNLSINIVRRYVEALGGQMELKITFPKTAEGLNQESRTPNPAPSLDN